ncbi:MAG: hypothetical protein WAN43_00625 [Rhodomicrobium sp.]
MNLNHYHVVALYAYDKCVDGVEDAKNPLAAVIQFFETLPDDVRGAVHDVVCTERRRPVLAETAAPAI